MAAPAAAIGATSLHVETPLSQLPNRDLAGDRLEPHVAARALSRHVETPHPTPRTCSLDPATALACRPSSPAAP